MLGYPKQPRDAGVAQEQGRGTRPGHEQLTMAELATRYDLDVLRRKLRAKIDTLSLRLMVCMGIMLAAGVAALAAIIKL